MKTAGGDNLGFLGVAASTIWGVVTGVYVVTTLLPSIIGAVMHTVNKARQAQLTLFDFIVSMLGALLIGVWGGPWVAEIVPKTEQALPIMCYLSAYYATDFSKWAKSVIEARFGGKSQGGDNEDT